MTKFIKVTEHNGSVQLLNVSRIESVCLGAKGNDTYIKLLKNSERENYFFVKESVEQVWEMLTPKLYYDTYHDTYIPDRGN